MIYDNFFRIKLKFKLEKMMTNNDDLLKELSDQLLMSEDYLKRLEESKLLPDEILSKYLSDLVALQNKHIPAEICSSGKLIERIDEVSSLIDNVNWEIDNLNKSS